jgi:predicted PurR-regulated permease PerM
LIDGILSSMTEQESRYADLPPAVRPLWAARRPPRWLPRATLYVALVVLGVMLVAQLLDQLRGLLVLVVMSLFLAFAMEPAITRLTARGWRRSRAAGLAMLVTAVALALFVWLLGRLLVDQVRELAEGLPDFADEATRVIDERFGTDLRDSDVVKELTSTDGPLPSLGRELAGGAIGIGASLLGLLFQLLTLVLFTYYLAKDGPRLRDWFCSFLPAHRQAEVVRLYDISVHRAGAYFGYRLTLAAISAVVHAGAFLLMDLPSAVALGVWVGIVSQFIPTVGTYVAAVLPLLVAVGEGWQEFLIVLVLVVVYQQVENYVLSPRLSAKAMNIHPAVGFGTVIAGTTLLGPVGAFLALPLVAIVQAFLATYIRRHEVVAVSPAETTGGSEPST